MKPVYFPRICGVVAHPNKVAIVKVKIKKAVISICPLDNSWSRL